MAVITGDWELETAVVDGGLLPAVAGHRVTLLVHNGGFNGTSACNRYVGELQAGDGGVRFDHIVTTVIGCPTDVLALESSYLAALGRVVLATSDGDRLVLSGTGVGLRFRRLSPAPLSAVADERWRLVSLLATDGVQAALPGAELLISSNGSISGSTGCRTFQGTYVVEGDELLTTSLSVDGGCPPGTPLAAQDSHVVDVLGDRFTLRVAEATLTVRHAPDLGLGYRLANTP